jgi:hypothetical protein
MRKITALVLGILLLNSCIPIRIAPSISDYKLTKGKRFKKGLPEKTVFAFEDPKDANAFYNYINTKYQLEDYYVDVEVPFTIEDKVYYLSFYEVEIPTKTLNLFTLAVDAALLSSDNDTIFDDSYEMRTGNWYIAIEVFSKTETDCLSEDSPSRAVVLPYLRSLKEEYLSTHNYNEVVFKN